MTRDDGRCGRKRARRDGGERSKNMCSSGDGSGGGDGGERRRRRAAATSGADENNERRRAAAVGMHELPLIGAREWKSAKIRAADDEQAEISLTPALTLDAPSNNSKAATPAGGPRGARSQVAARNNWAAGKPAADLPFSASQIILVSHVRFFCSGRFADGE